MSKVQYCDVHAHLADSRIREETSRILDECRRHNVTAVVANAARRQEWPEICRLSSAEPVWGALGLHPFFAEQWHEDAAAELSGLIKKHERIIAVGEIGLDFVGDRNNVAEQSEIFRLQIMLAQSLNLPVILHNRKSWSLFFRILKEMNLPGLSGVCHHFSSSTEVARQALDKGLYLSFCGPLTYDNARRIKEAVRYAPLERILTETDTPDLPTAAHRGEFSYPYHVPEIVTQIARLKKRTEIDVADTIMQNFGRLFASAGKRKEDTAESG